MNRIIETERLTLRPLIPDDAGDVFEWAGDPIANRFMPYPAYMEEAAVRRWIESLVLENNEFGFVLKSTGKVIGSGSVRFDEQLQAYVFGYNLNRAYWGNGYATEAAKAMIGWARRELGARDFAAVYADANTASGRVIEKCGLTFSHHTNYGKFDGSEVFEASVMEAHFED